jgi:hypothetical protein
MAMTPSITTTMTMTMIPFITITMTMTMTMNPFITITMNMTRTQFEIVIAIIIRKS